jgi:hypothetical protein
MDNVDEEECDDPEGKDDKEPAKCLAQAARVHSGILASGHARGAEDLRSFYGFRRYKEEGAVVCDAQEA